MLDGTRESWKDQVDIFDKIRSDVIQLELPTFFHSDILSSLFDIDCG